MTVSLDTNVVYLKDRLNINTGRMNNYAEKSLDDIITEESKQGNKQVNDYGREVFNNADELIQTFQLENPSNKLNILNSMSEDQRNNLLPMLGDEDMVMGLNFYTQDENKNMVIKQLQAMLTEALIQMVEGITGVASTTDDSMALIEQIGSLPDKQYKETMANMDPNIQAQVVFQMANDNKKILAVFDSSAYTGMMHRLQKPEMVKSMVALESESLQQMVTQLPPELLSVVETQVNTEELAKYLMSNCQDVLSKLGSR